jgi:hypothetical protein
VDGTHTRTHPCAYFIGTSILASSQIMYPMFVQVEEIFYYCLMNGQYMKGITHDMGDKMKTIRPKAWECIMLIILCCKRNAVYNANNPGVTNYS